MASWASVKYDKASIHGLMFALGHQELNPVASVLLLFGLGLWVWCNRRKNMWLLIAVTAFVARFWTYHGWYDDVLILLPMIALFRIATYRVENCKQGRVSAVLFALMLLSIMAPGGRYLFPNPWNLVYIFGQVSVWLTVLFFLIAYARSQPDLGGARNLSPAV